MFIASIIFICSLEYKANVKTNFIIIPLVLISMFFLFVSNLKNFSTARMYPLLGDGFTNTFIFGIKNIYVFGGIAFLYFLPPLLKEPEKFKKISLYSITLSAIYILMTVSIILFMFAYFVNIDEIMPLFSAARNIEFGSFFQRLESIFLLIWMIIFACYISISMTFCLEVSKKLANLNDSTPIVAPLGILFFGIAMIAKNYSVSTFLESEVYPYLNLGITFVLSITLLILANIKLKKTKPEKSKQKFIRSR